MDPSAAVASAAADYTAEPVEAGAGAAHADDPEAVAAGSDAEAGS